MNRFSFLAMTFVGLAALLTWSPTGVEAWPGFSALYQCCCPENPACGKCFMCRNNHYSCYCDICSCYADGGSSSEGLSTENELMASLMRSGKK